MKFTYDINTLDTGFNPATRESIQLHKHLFKHNVII